MTRLRRSAAFGMTLAIVLGMGGRSGATEIPIESGPLSASVRLDPFGITFAQDGGEALADLPPDAAAGGPGTLAFAVGAAAAAQTPSIGYGLSAEAPLRWFHATRATSDAPGHFTVATDDPAGRTFDLTVAPGGDGIITVHATLSDTTGVVETGWSFARPEGERFLGFGERSDGADQTGKVVEAWNEEGPWSAGALKPATDPTLGDRWQGPTPFPGTNFSMPWLVSSRGYGVLLDTSWPNRFRLGSDSPGAWSLESRDPSVNLRVYAGPRPADVVARFSNDTGRQPDPAPWFFGVWYQPHGPLSEQQLNENWRGVWDTPVTVDQTYAHYFPCGSQVGHRPGQKARVDAGHALGFMVTTYVNSFVCQNHPGGAYEEGDEGGFFVKNAAGETYLVPMVLWVQDSPWEAIVDFTNPAAAQWWQGWINQALEDGYDGWMEDFGEYVPPDAVMADGRSGAAAHNDYCTAYHKASDDLTRPIKGLDFAQFVRCGYTGTAKHARIVWGGDPTEDYSKADGLAAAVSEGISMGMSGVGYWGSDIGGFHSVFTKGQTDDELLTRWLEFGAFSGIMRTEADGWARPEDSSVRAQVWDPGVLPIWRKYAKLRTQLYPYVWAAAQEYRATGMPIMRHLALAYPDDARVYSPEAEYEYLFGPNMLVAPVIEPGATTRTLYLPPGEWIDFWQTVGYDEGTGAFDIARPPAIVTGGRVVTWAAPRDRIPLFVRAGACLRLLPADVDTLARAPEGITDLEDAQGHERTLAFGGTCS